MANSNSRPKSGHSTVSQFEAAREWVRSRLWPIPAVFAVIATGAGIVLGTVDRDIHGALGFTNHADTARALLSTIAASMITFTGLVFSITMVTLQLATAQFSPRVLRSFLRDRTSKLALGTFVATFVFAAMTLRFVQENEAPGLSINVAIVMVIASIGVFINYINHISQSIRLSSLVNAIGEETRETIDRVFPTDGKTNPDPPERAGTREIRSPDQGSMTSFDGDKLVRLAARSDVVIEFVPHVGAFITVGQPVLLIHGPGEIDEEVALASVHFAAERTMRQDVAFGIRQLVDIAAKALSPGINDPTSAVQAIDQIHDCLSRLGNRPMPPGRIIDDQGSTRVIYPVLSWEQYVSLALDEIRIYGHKSVQVLQKLTTLVEDLRQRVTPPDRIRPLDNQAEVIERTIDQSFSTEHDRAIAGGALRA